MEGSQEGEGDVHAYDLEGFRTGTTFGTDGSGGEHSDDPRLRRCGAGVAVLGSASPGVRPELLAGLAMSVPGRQTVPRAELIAVCRVLELAKQPLIEIVTDANYIIKGFRRGPFITKSYNWDLWRRFWLAIEKRGGPRTVKMYKIKSVQRVPPPLYMFSYLFLLKLLNLYLFHKGYI